MPYEREVRFTVQLGLNSDGQIAWKATPRLRNYLMDLQLNAETDLEEV